MKFLYKSCKYKSGEKGASNPFDAEADGVKLDTDEAGLLFRLSKQLTYEELSGKGFSDEECRVITCWCLGI